MNRFAIFAVVAASLLWTSAAGAQEFIEKRVSGQTLASGLIGQTIYGPTSEELGKITDLLLDPGRTVVGVVVKAGEKTIALPYSALLAKITGDDMRYVVSLDAAAIAAAPSFNGAEVAAEPPPAPAPCGGRCPGDPMANPTPAN
jgi:hypothetical protein